LGEGGKVAASCNQGVGDPLHGFISEGGADGIAGLRGWYVCWFVGLARWEEKKMIPAAVGASWYDYGKYDEDEEVLL
jgi:hypothetical protein